MTILKNKAVIKSTRETTFHVSLENGVLKRGQQRDLSALDISDIQRDFNKNGECILWVGYSPNGSVYDRWTHNYDLYNNLTESLHYLLGYDLFERFLYENDKNRNCIREQLYQKENSYSIDFELIEKTVNVYYCNKIIEKNIVTVKNGTSYRKTYKYDSKWNCVEYIEYSPNNPIYYGDPTPTRIVHSKYDDKSNLIEQSISEYDYKQCLTKNSVLKFINGNLIEIIEYSTQGKLDYIIALKYDIFNNEIESIKTESNGICISNITNYKLDKMNNWIEKIHLENDSPKYITERIIEYY